MNPAWLFNEGKNIQSYLMLGALPADEQDGGQGFRFACWAPRAEAVSVVGDFNEWDPTAHPLQLVGSTGIWRCVVPDARVWQRYKFLIHTRTGQQLLKADPFARHAETRPNTASVLYNPNDDYTWHDESFCASRKDATEAGPLNIYEVHLGSWRRYPDGNVYNYRDIAPQLVDYCIDMGYNAVELMPIMEYPLDASWGYQSTGYFAPTSRYGTPADFKAFVDIMHQAGLRVILDWVPSHFPKDDFALARFDGLPLFEHPDATLAEHADWGTLVFNYGLKEVVSFLMSSAWFWIEEFHADGLRYDAVSSMLYLNFGRSNARPNKKGGYEDLDAIAFLRQLNQRLRKAFPYCILAAEESSAYSYVSSPVEEGGLGFTHKWNLGWMNDTLSYMKSDYYARSQFHEKITFSMMYAFSERFILPFSHDEVVHGKKSLLGRMPGDEWRKFASLRACYMYQMSHPGAKLNFMGNEYAPYIEWRYYEELEWFMLQYEKHSAMKSFCRDLNRLYLESSSFWDVDDSWDGFQWMDANDRENSIFSYARMNADKSEIMLVILNMTPASYPSFRIRVPNEGQYRLILNSDSPRYGGSGYAGLDEDGVVFHTIDRAASEKNKGAPGMYERIVSAGKQNGTAGASDDSLDNHRQRMVDSPAIDMPIPPLSGIYLLYEGHVGNINKSGKHI